MEPQRSGGGCLVPPTSLDHCLDDGALHLFETTGQGHGNGVGLAARGDFADRSRDLRSPDLFFVRQQHRMEDGAGQLQGVARLVVLQQALESVFAKTTRGLRRACFGDESPAQSIPFLYRAPRR